MFNTSYIEISKSALKNNIIFLRSYLGNKIRLSSVIKGNAYGHCISKFVPMAEECGIDHFSVFSACEALEAFKVSSGSTILIMGYIGYEEIAWAIENDIEFFVSDLDKLNKSLEIAKRIKKKAKLHIDIETGMNRTGFQARELKKVREVLKSNGEYLIFKGLCTHYAGAESITNYVRVKKQIRRYKRVLRGFIKSDLTPQLRHTASSAAAIAYPESRMDLVRIGIMQYGFWPSMETYIYYLSRNNVKINPLKRVLTWKSSVMGVKKVKRGEFIGYNTSFLAPANMKIATIPVGYSDGYSRSLSNYGRVLINGKRANVIGLVSMNMMIVDVSKLPQIKKGDEVVLIGKQKNRSITVSSFSKFTSHDINYELLARLTEHIPRVITD